MSPSPPPETAALPAPPGFATPRTQLSAEEREQRRAAAKAKQRQISNRRQQTAWLIGLSAMLLLGLPVAWRMAFEQESANQAVVYRQPVINRRVHEVNWVVTEQVAPSGGGGPAAVAAAPAASAPPVSGGTTYSATATAPPPTASAPSVDTATS